MSIFKSLVLGTLLGLVALTVGAKQPNIILIVADDLGWRDSSAYKSEFYQTPGIDRLASEGVLFTDAYSSNPLCSPTRASILTGQSPARLRFTAASGHIQQAILDPKQGTAAAVDKPAIIPQSRSRLPNEYVTYAELLQEAGYRTAFMGKWHVGSAPYIPENQGFDVVIGGRHHPGPPPPGGFFAPWEVETIPDYPKGTHISDAITDEALKFIKANRSDPFLLNLWFYDVHAPFQAKPALVDKYEQLVDPDYPQRSPTMGAMIEAMDQNIERLLQELDRMGLRDDTIIIFTSDNGGNMYNEVDGTTPTNNFPLKSGKGNNYEGGVRVPLIVSWAGVSRPGTMTDSVVCSADLYPTILNMAGLPQHPEHHKDGIDFSAAIAGEFFDRGPFISHFPHYVPATDNLPNTSVRVGDYKLYRFYYDGENQAHRYELYNLKTDIGETNNLADSMPEKVSQLDATIEAYLQEAEVLVPIKNPRFASKPVMGWNVIGDVELTAEDGVLRMDSHGRDPRISSHDFHHVSGPVALSFTMRSKSIGKGQVFWTSPTVKGFKGDHSASFSVKQDGAWHDYVVQLPFTGKLNSIRLDPSQGEGRIELKNIRLLGSNGQVLHTWK
ncbi:sulfatase [Coraliomargarita sp. SDUM461003]|uniref:Sulfatase n=1 Tax=Thalassobacterium maritimum TaxID=3041265 RepID=A0ABU1AUS8_9BACT|nr:sulfatase [Coraliomargarita sp. SDUM461003]MDQ8207910.1 sulfatase [Coraliomargarita sp. SDUM461003]